MARRLKVSVLRALISPILFIFVFLEMDGTVAEAQLGPQGQELPILWDNLHCSGRFPSQESAVAVGTDSSGNTYVVGSTDSPLSGQDYLVVKHGPDGSILWIVTYNGSWDMDDVPGAAAIAADGSVLVSGTSVEDVGYRITTVKVTSDGKIAWVAHEGDPEMYPTTFDYVRSCQLDESGYAVIVAAYFTRMNPVDILTIKYSPAGEKLWETLHHLGDAQESNYPAHLAIDHDGRIAVTGKLLYTHDRAFCLMLDSDGQPQWEAFLEEASYGRAVAFGSNGNTYMAMQMDWRAGLACYDSAGKELYCTRYDSSAISDATDLCMDQEDNAFVVGYVGWSILSDCLILRFRSDGALLWARCNDGGVLGRDYARAVAVDQAGSVYVTAQSDDSASYSRSFYTMKYDTSGRLLWSVKQTGNARFRNQDGPADLATIHPSGVVVTGMTTDSINGADLTTVCYDALASLAWVNSYTGPPVSRDYAMAVDVESEGNILVAGFSVDVNREPRSLLLKYSPAGQELWQYYSEIEKGVDLGISVKADRDGDVYVLSTISLPGSPDVLQLLKVSGQGQVLWKRHFDDAGIGCEAMSLVVDPCGNAVVSGWLRTREQLVLKYSSTGSILWRNRRQNTEYGQPLGSMRKRLAMDDDSNIITWVKDNGTVVTKYDSSGTLMWETRLPSPDTTFYDPVGLVVGESGNIFLTGPTIRLPSFYTALTPKAISPF